MQNRIKKIKIEIKQKRIETFLITDILNIRYLTNFSGSNAVCLLMEDKQYIISDSRYEEQIFKEVEGYKILISKISLFDEIFKRKLFRGIKKVGFESESLSYFTVQKLKKLFPEVQFIPLSGIIENISAIKTEDEIEKIKKSIKIADLAFNKILSFIKPGVKESDISAEISYIMRKAGSERDAFDPIVASGSNSSMPHAKSTAKVIRKGEPVLLDFGAIYNGYNSDISRTLFVGKPDKEFTDVYKIVAEAQMMAINKTRSGITSTYLDSIARDYIKESGYGKYFGHSLGHGLGLKPHSSPLISPHSKESLKNNMVFTIEPGIYLPEKFGVRIEDDIVINENGCEVLTKSEKKLIIL